MLRKAMFRHIYLSIRI